MTSRNLETNEVIEYLARSISARGWKQEAIYILEAGQPLAFIAGQLLWVFQPILNLFVSQNDVAKFAQTLEEPEGINHLIQRIEANEG
jgi:hypothetical protein